MRAFYVIAYYRRHVTSRHVDMNDISGQERHGMCEIDIVMFEQVVATCEDNPKKIEILSLLHLKSFR